MAEPLTIVGNGMTSSSRPPHDKLVLATGSTPRRIFAEGRALPGRHLLGIADFPRKHAVIPGLIRDPSRTAEPQHASGDGRFASGPESPCPAMLRQASRAISGQVQPDAKPPIMLLPSVPAIARKPNTRASLMLGGH